MSRTGTVRMAAVVACLLYFGHLTPAQAACATTTSQYSQLVAGTASLAGYWRLGDRTGSAACDSLGAHDGVYKPSVQLGVRGALAADSDPAAAFDGSSALVVVRSASDLTVQDSLTLEAWVRPSSLSGRQAVVRKTEQYMLRLSGATLQARLWWSPKSSTGVMSAAIMRPGVWQHVVFTYDGAEMRLYRDGVLVAARGARRTTAFPRHPVLIGSSGNHDFFAGRLDEVAIYAAALSPADVLAHFAAAGGPRGCGRPGRTGGRGHRHHRGHHHHHHHHRGRHAGSATH